MHLFLLRAHAHIYTHMRFAIIAAGEGSRLREEGITMPKPLVRVNGERLIDRLLRIFTANGASEIIVVCNDLTPLVDEHLKQIECHGLNGIQVPLRHIVRTTPSSMHSLYAMADMLRGEPFILTTVDTVFDEGAFAEYVKAFSQSDADCMMAVTNYIDDEKPLFVATDGDMITAFMDCDSRGTCQYISAGIYGLSDKALSTLKRCINEGQHRMRNFQRGLIADGLSVKAFPMGKVLDVDHREDITKAEQTKNAVGIYRHHRYSPNSVERDQAIMDEVIAQLKAQGIMATTITEETLLAGAPLPHAALYLSMARSPEVLSMLHDKNCINSPLGITLCNNRKWLDDSQSAEPNDPKCWIKRADGCAETDSDVTYCASPQQATAAIEALRKRGITSYIMQPHYDGDLVKFYGVAGSEFFCHCYPTEIGHSKFGFEQSINGKPHHYPFDVHMLQQSASAIALRIGINAYGGDAIISADGSMHIIDFNDWPSYSVCQKKAAQAIVARATLLMN